MKLKKTLLAGAALSLFAGASAAAGFEFGGYFRVGPGQKVGNVNCVGAPMDGGTYRLGNECNTYGEFDLRHLGKAGNVDYKANLMVNFFKNGNDARGEKIGLQQLYAEGKGFDIAPNQSFWVGTKFHGRADVHITDFFVVDMTGTGAGVDGIDLGVGLLNLAAFRNDNGGTRFNADLQDINSNAGGKLRLTGTLTNFEKGGEDGLALSLQHNQNVTSSVSNTLWLQFANGSAYLNQGFGGGGDSADDVSRFRIVDAVNFNSGAVSAQLFGIVGSQENADVTEDFASFGGRLSYAFTKNFKVLTEAGVSLVTQSPLNGPDGEQQQLTKFTIAPTLSIGQGFYDRPELRMYYTLHSFNEAFAKGNGDIADDDTTAHGFGFQAEMWF